MNYKPVCIERTSSLAGQTPRATNNAFHPDARQSRSQQRQFSVVNYWSSKCAMSSAHSDLILPGNKILKSIARINLWTKHKKATVFSYRVSKPDGVHATHFQCQQSSPSVDHPTRLAVALLTSSSIRPIETPPFHKIG